MIISILCGVVMLYSFFVISHHMKDGSGTTVDISTSYVAAIIHVALIGLAAIQLYINW